MHIIAPKISSFQQALLSAFPRYAGLEQMLRLQLDKRLAVMVEETGMETVIFKLIEIAEADGWLKDLLKAARAANPDNPALATFEQSLPIDVRGKLAQQLSRVPHRRQDQIVGRAADLKDLHEKLRTKGTVVLVNGMGGIGKTALAEVYVDTYQENYHYIIWVTQLPEENLMNSFIQTNSLLENLGINTLGKEPDILYREIFLNLKNIAAKPNLLVIDNADKNLLKDYASLQELRHWHILATSREYFGADILEIKELGFLSEEEAILLFKEYYKPSVEISEPEMRELVILMEYHTLAIEILAKTADTKKKTAAELKNIFKENPNIPEVTVRHGSADIPRKVAKINAYLDEMFVLAALNEEEQWLLLQMLCLPLEAHSYELLKALIHPEIHQKEDIFPDLLVGLDRKGWLLHNAADDSYRIHRIIAEVVDRSLKKELSAIKPLVEEVSKRLEIDQTKDNPVDKFEWIPFGEAILKCFEDGESELIAALQHNLGTVLQALGDYAGAKVLLEKALESNEKNFGTEHPTTVTTYSNLGTVLQALGDYAGAKVLLEKALESNEKNFGAEHPTTATAYSNLATVLRDLGDYVGAKKLLEKALVANEKHFGVEHPTTANTYSNLATVLRDLGDYKGAKKLLKKALAADEKNFGAEHPTTATIYSNLATVLKDLGDYAGAKRLLEKAVASDEKNLGEKHPSTAISYSNLALVLYNLGDYERAKVLLEKVLASDEKNFGVAHPTTAISYSNLAMVLYNLDNFEEAKALLEKAYRIFAIQFGDNHPHTQKAKNNLDQLL